MLAFTSLIALSLPLAAFAQYGYDTPAAAKSSSTPMAAAATPTAAAASAIQTVVVGTYTFNLQQLPICKLTPIVGKVEALSFTLPPLSSFPWEERLHSPSPPRTTLFFKVALPHPVHTPLVDCLLATPLYVYSTFAFVDLCINDEGFEKL